MSDHTPQNKILVKLWSTQNPTTQKSVGMWSPQKPTDPSYMSNSLKAIGFLWSVHRLIDFLYVKNGLNIEYEMAIDLYHFYIKDMTI